jgi:hypothetical protein
MRRLIAIIGPAKSFVAPPGFSSHVQSTRVPPSTGVKV